MGGAAPESWLHRVATLWLMRLNFLSVAECTRELSAANQQLEDMAMTDILTGQPHRREDCLKRCFG